jgi:hypothetical protein
MSRALLDLHVLFEDASLIALSLPTAALRGEHRTGLRPSVVPRGRFRTEVLRLPGCWLQLLSWGSPKTAPSSTYAASVHSRSTPSRCMHRLFLDLRPGAATCQARSVLAVPPDFDGFLRSRAAGLLHPAANHGVHCVSTSSSSGHRCSCADRSAPSHRHLRNPSGRGPVTLVIRVRPSGLPAVYDLNFPVSGHPSKVFPPTQRSTAGPAFAGNRSLLLPGWNSLQAARS